MKALLVEGFIGVDMPPLPDDLWQGIGFLQLTEEPLSLTSFTLATWSIPAEAPITTQGETGRNGIIRWYDPVTGRFLSNDPIGISGGLDQYVFCANNPVNFRDPLGLDIWVASRWPHKSINVGDPCGTFSSYSLMDVPTFTVFGIGIYGDVLNPLNNGGIIYSDDEPGRPDLSRYLYTSAQEDSQARQILDQMVGDNLPYRLIGSTCRNFSTDMFNFFKDDLHFGKKDKSADSCK